MADKPALPGMPRGVQDASQRSSLPRTSWFQPQGFGHVAIMECIIIDLNIRNWTVDVISKFDQKQFLDIQVGSPYMHSNYGEGIYAYPDVGAKCHVCIPSDGLPPYILDFIMPQETLDSTATDEAPAGTQSRGAVTQDADQDSTFAGGRPKPKPGDIYLRGRDGSFIVMHRGGVLQMGSTQVAQRIYIPLNNVVMDLSQNYRHYNMGGSINWLVDSAAAEENNPTSFMQTFRLFAPEENASVRVALGRVKDYVREKSGDAGAQSEISQLEIDENDIVCEVDIAPHAFEANSGSTVRGVIEASTLRYFLTKAGDVALRTSGALLVKVAKKLWLISGDDMLLKSGGNLNLEAEGIVRVIGGKLMEVGTRGGTMKLNAGTNPVAHVGSTVTIAIGAPLTITGTVVVPPSPTPLPFTGIIASGQTITGVITTGNPLVQV